MAPPANSLTLGHRHRCKQHQPLPQPRVLKVAMVSPDRNATPYRVQTYDVMPAPVRPQHALANWTSVRLGNDPNTQKGKEEETGGTTTNDR